MQMQASHKAAQETNSFPQSSKNKSLAASLNETINTFVIIKEPQGHDLTFCLNTLHELYEKNSLRPSHTEMSITEEQFAFLIGSLSKGPFDEAQLTKSLNFFCSIREPEY